jgi:hypothetical protein
MCQVKGDADGERAMKRRALILGAGAFALVVAIAAAPSFAEGTACGNETTVIPDGRITESSFTGSTTFWYIVATRVGHSYCAEWKNTSGAAADDPGTVSAFTACGTPFASTRDAHDIDPKDSFNTERWCWTATATAHRFSVQRTAGSTIPYSFLASDTTLFSPAWSTNGVYDTFYSFQNTTGATINGTLTLFDTTGAQLTSFPLTINANQTTSTNTAALVVTRNKTGTARFSHNGPAGAILAEAAIASFAISPPYVQTVKFSAVRDVR